MKATKIKVGTVVLRWNGASYDSGLIFKTLTKNGHKYVEIKFGPASAPAIRIRKEEIKWQKRYLYDKKQWTKFRWICPGRHVYEVPVIKIEDGWIKTYRAGKLISMKLTDKAYSDMGKNHKKELDIH